MGCSVKEPNPLENSRNIEKLSNLFIQLDQQVNPIEAKSLAQESILYAQKLAKEYELVSPPYVQNTLVNLGLKKRGLCYEWAEDLYTYLRLKNYSTLRLHRVGANIGKLNEHNALSVSFMGKKSILKNILLDAWRNSGNLFFIKIEEDKKYDWKERFYK
jgi:hypothetical protein